LEAGAILGSLGLGAILGLRDTEDIIRAGVTGVAKVILELQEIKVFQGFRRAKVILGSMGTSDKGAHFRFISYRKSVAVSKAS
jgi:hypothetical protein